MEFDALFMDGDTRNVGAVAGVTHFLPVRVARRLMQEELHTMLIGQGAETFAKECGFQPEPALSLGQLQKWEQHVKPLLENRGSKSLLTIVRDLALPSDRNLDTVAMIAGDGKGLSGAASTAGWPYKHPGRVGDSPLAGAGLYVDSRYGGSLCTYTGEMSTRICCARSVVSHMEASKGPRDAVHAAIEDLSHLSGGVLRALTILAVTPNGLSHAAAVNAKEPVFYQFWHSDLLMPEIREAEAVSLSFR
jgi:L-asparaginase